MRTLAVSVAALLVLAVVSPAFAQPFADVPTDHWAFDAIAELAAKGIIEGFPDGTFKGERGVTRYELAMVVARILARIEAIKIPGPAAPAAPAAPAPQVTRADVQTIQRLVNEFRAELAALGVRVTAVEEELTALKTSVSATKVGGDVRYRYDIFPNNLTIPTATAAGASVSDFQSRLTFTGTISPDVKFVQRLEITGFGPASAAEPTTKITYDKRYLDASLFGLSWRAGWSAFTLGSGVGYSGYGLIFDPGNAATGLGGYTGIGYIAGLTVGGALAGFNYQFGAFPADPVNAMDIYSIHADTNLSGWALGLNAIYQLRHAAVAAGAGMPTEQIGATSGNLATTAAATAGSNDTGYELELTGSLFPGLTLGAGYATFNPNTGPSSNAYIGWLGFDLTAMGMAGWKATAWYKNYGSSTIGAQIPVYAGATTEAAFEAFTAWNFTGWGVALDADFGSGWSGTLTYESGNQSVTGGPTVVEYQAIAKYALAPNTTISFNWFKGTLGAYGVTPQADYDSYYRIELLTSY